MHRWLMGCAAGAVAAFVLGAAAPAGPTTQPSGADRVEALVNGHDEAAERRAFVRVAGSDGELSEDEFATDVKRKGGFVCPYDRWELAVVHDGDGNGRLNWSEAQGYRQALRQRLLKDHDRDGDGKLTGAEMVAASTDLQNGVRRPGHGNATQPAALASWDVNRNGKLEEPEKKAMREHYMVKARQRRRQWELARYDSDRDGKLSEAERAEMNGAMGARRRPEGMGIQRWDKDGDGKLSEGEAGAMRYDLAAQRNETYVAMWDANGDGRLDEEELRAAREFYRELRERRATPAELRRYDRDHDGKLNRLERSRMAADDRLERRRRTRRGPRRTRP